VPNLEPPAAVNVKLANFLSKWLGTLIVRSLLSSVASRRAHGLVRDRVCPFGVLFRQSRSTLALAYRCLMTRRYSNLMTEDLKQICERVSLLSRVGGPFSGRMCKIEHLPNCDVALCSDEKQGRLPGNRQNPALSYLLVQLPRKRANAFG